MLEDVTRNRAWFSPNSLERSMVDFIRFSLHAGIGFRENGPAGEV
ncbi:MAG: hypothetical protein H6R26_3297 [Proteobacteria bacterium]|nr:hypothetical protein [Pseudomonadota bacterium]